MSDLPEIPIGKVGDLKNEISRLVVNQSSKFENLLNARWYDYIVLNFQADRTRNAFTVNNFLRGNILKVSSKEKVCFGKKIPKCCQNLGNKSISQLF